MYQKISVLIIEDEKVSAILSEKHWIPTNTR